MVGRRQAVWVRPLFKVMVAMLLVSGCVDSDTAMLTTSEVSWDRLVIVSAVPAKRSTLESGAWVYEPTCQAVATTADSLILNVLLQGQIPEGTEADKDLSIKPNDRVDLRTIVPGMVVPEMFQVGISCMEPSPYADTSAARCTSGIMAESLPIGDVSYYNYGDGEELDTRGNVALAVLIDMSGSMGGLVSPFPPYEEGRKSDVTLRFPTGFFFRNNATDPGDARLRSVVELIETLNIEDEMIVYTFNEENVDVICYLPGDPTASYETKKAECLSTDRTLVLGAVPTGLGGPLMQQSGTAQGRTPLWFALKEAYQQMRTPSATSAAFRHILVITDGPDTCSSSADLDRCTGACTKYNTSFSEFQALVETDGQEPRVPIHFIQMGAKGYPDRDARQMEIACLTGGHYIFIDSNTLRNGLLEGYLITILKRIRYTFRGYWRIPFEFSAIDKREFPPSGHIYTLTGQGKVLPGKDGLLVKAENTFVFDQESDFGDEITIDSTLSVRKPCDPKHDDALCGPSEPAPRRACATFKFWCDDDTLTCRHAQVWVANGETQYCQYVKAKIRIFKTSNDNNPEILSFSDLPSRCCAGDCIPPSPPEMPFSKNVFTYLGQWYLEDPSDMNSAWIMDSEYRAEGDPTVSLQQVKDALFYPNPSALAWPGDWSCPPEHSENCFPGPGTE